jgi:hypothetical protein
VVLLICEKFIVVIFVHHSVGPSVVALAKVHCPHLPPVSLSVTTWISATGTELLTLLLRIFRIDYEISGSHGGEYEV